MTTSLPDGAEVLSYIDRLSNWGRWGADDQRGTLNLIRDEHRVAAARLVTEGRTVSCARELTTRFGDPGSSAQLMWIGTGEAACLEHEALPDGFTRGRMASAKEFFGLAFHGYHVTHLDTQAHVFWEGRQYNDRPAFLTTAEFGALWCAVTEMGEGIVGRGVLLDVPRALGSETLAPGHAVTRAELEATADAQHVGVGEGDIVLMRTGRWHADMRAADDAAGVRPGDRPGAMCGWHPTCMVWMHERDVAMIGCDYPHEASDARYPEFPGAVHVLGLVAMGMPLLDNLDLEALATTCSELGRWEFQFVVAPLRIKGGSGSPVNPLAMF
jgi:kynurenine formamidase